MTSNPDGPEVEALQQQAQGSETEPAILEAQDADECEDDATVPVAGASKKKHKKKKKNAAAASVENTSSAVEASTEDADFSSPAEASSTVQGQSHVADSNGNATHVEGESNAGSKDAEQPAPLGPAHEEPVAAVIEHDEAATAVVADASSPAAYKSDGTPAPSMASPASPVPPALEQPSVASPAPSPAPTPSAATKSTGDEILATPNTGTVRELMRKLSIREAGSFADKEAPSPGGSEPGASTPASTPQALPRRRTTSSHVAAAPAVISSHDKQNTTNALQLLRMGSFKKQPLVDTLPYEELIKLRLEDGIDPTRREDYLDEEEFTKVFGMNRETFKAMPAWKRTQKKKEVGLF